MVKASLKKNFLMNILLTGSSYIFPLITFPYISRVLQAAGNGKINFALSVANYFVMFASLGIPMYGIKVCAEVRDDKKKLSRTVKELLILNFITSVVAFFLLLVLIALVPKFQGYISLLLVDSITIWLNLIGMEWLFKALEDYSYITKRSIIFKIISIVLMFLFVHKQSDLVIYAIISLVGTSGSLILNVFRCRKIISFNNVGKVNLRQHISPIVTFFFLSASWTIYMNMDSVMLGFISGDTEVGYYAAAVKLKGILVSTISALGTVLLPRLTSFFSQKRMEEFYELLRRDAEFIVISATFFTCYCIVNAREIMIVLSGYSYLPAVPAMQFISNSILFIGLSTMLGTNILIPIGKEKVTMFATLFGLIVDVIFILLLAPDFGAAGAAMATVLGEICIFLFELVYLRDSAHLFFNFKSILREFCAILVAAIFLIVSKILLSQFLSEILLIIATGLIFTFASVLTLLLFGDSFTRQAINNMLKRIRR